MNLDVTIVLLSHKSKDLILNYVRDIYNKFEIIIIDNSDDKKLEIEIKKKYPKIILKLIENNGYGAAVNYASKLVNTKYFLISNPDIEGLDEEKILNFVDAANELDDKFSSLGPHYINADKKSHIQSDSTIKIAEMKFISGACMFFKKDTFDLLGGFDENFFLYFEESDFCLRSYKINKNYQINYIKIVHNVGSSVKTENDSERKKLNRLYTWHFIWSKFYYYKKNYGFLYALVYFIPIILRIFLKIIFFSCKNDHENIEKYKTRLSGLLNSIIGKKSFKRLEAFK